MVIDYKKINHSKIGFFRFGKIGKQYLLTNQTGAYVFLSGNDFKKYLAGRMNEKSLKYKELASKDFIAEKANPNKQSETYSKKNDFLFRGPSLHIVVVTRRCNYNCVYCQASAKGLDPRGLDMDLKTAKKIVDFIFSSPSKFLAIEFQGGEPLLNWDVVKFIVQHAREKNKAEKRNLELRLVSNFSLMDDEKLDFCFDNLVSLCTSLDGPESLHNKNRPFSGGNSYQKTTQWLGKAMDKYRKLEKKDPGKYIYQPGALTTTSRFSLGQPKQIVDEYLKRGFETIFLRPLSPLGSAGKVWDKIGYSADEYLDFYAKALDYVLELNKQGKKFFERTATIILAKILTEHDPNYLELRSPCGAGLGQMAYDLNGDIYSCDEGRMVSYGGDKIFRLGNVYKDKYVSVIENPVLKTMCLASEINSQPQCSDCVYSPYCGLCPIYNYVTQGSIYGQMASNGRCRIQKGVMEIIFKKLADPANEKILMRWAQSELRKGRLKEG